jgi:hypothetical protein
LLVYFLNFTKAGIKHFTIDTSLTRLEKKEKNLYWEPN